jgi:hypothetical protein
VCQRKTLCLVSRFRKSNEANQIDRRARRLSKGYVQVTEVMPAWPPQKRRWYAPIGFVVVHACRRWPESGRSQHWGSQASRSQCCRPSTEMMWVGPIRLIALEGASVVVHASRTHSFCSAAKGGHTLPRTVFLLGAPLDLLDALGQDGVLLHEVVDAV